MNPANKIDYSLRLPQLLETNTCHETLKKAQRIIHLLSCNADTVVEGTYRFHHQEITLPREYYFGSVPVCFLPGWSSYTLGSRKNFTTTFHLPHGHDELLSDIESTREFLARYESIKGKSAKQKAKDAWERKMHKRIAV